MKSLSLLLKLPAFCAMAVLLSSCALNGGPGTLKEDRLQTEMAALEPVAEDWCALIKERHALARDHLYLVSQSSCGTGDNQGLKDIEEALKRTGAKRAASFEDSADAPMQVKIYQSDGTVADDLSLKVKAVPANSSEQNAGGSGAYAKSAQSSPGSLFDTEPVYRLEDLLVYALKDKLSLEGAALCASPDKCSGKTLIVGVTDTGSQILASIDEGSSSIYRLYRKSGASYVPASQFSIIAKEG